MEPTPTSDGPQEIRTDADEGRRSRTPLILVALAALVVGGAVGGVVGWKVEQNRVESDVDDVRESARRNVRPVGTVTAVTDDSVTIDLTRAPGSRVFELSDATVIETATSSDSTDIVEGATILVQTRRASDGTQEAVEIIVLPDTSTFAEDSSPG